MGNSPVKDDTNLITLKKVVKGGVILQADSIIPYKQIVTHFENVENLSEEIKQEKQKEIDKIDKQLEAVKNGFVNSIELIDLNGKKITITQKQASKEGIEEYIGYNVRRFPDFYQIGQKYKYNGNVLFEKDKLYVNLWNFVYKVKSGIPNSSKFKDDSKTLYYTLKDGQTVKLNFWEINATALTVPFKYRPKSNSSEDIKGVFSTSFNAGLFGGISHGRTKFHYRKKVGNQSFTEKISLGMFLGAASETLTEKNTNDGSGLTDSESQTIGLASIGTGLVFSRNKLSLGLFMGWDLGIGSLSDSWDYNGRLWLGVGLGYDIFKL